MSLDESLRRILRDEVRAVLREEIGTLLDKLDEHAAVESSASSSSEFLTTKEAAAIARVGASTIRTWIGNGSLKRYGRGNHFLVARHELEQWLTGEDETTSIDLSVDDLANAIVAKACGT